MAVIHSVAAMWAHVRTGRELHGGQCRSDLLLGARFAGARGGQCGIADRHRHTGTAAAVAVRRYARRPAYSARHPAAAAAAANLTSLTC